jgi:AcrR family transcriptional regulator
MTTTEPPRRRGRQAEAARNDRLLLDAAREVFISQGFDAPVAAVAERAGVGIGSLYRRYATKEELLQRLCLDAMEQHVEVAQAALDRELSWPVFARYIKECSDRGAGALAPVAGTIRITAEMAQTSERVGELAGMLLGRAHSAGLLRPDVTAVDLTYLIEQFSRRRPGPQTEDDENARRRLLAIALDGLRAHNTDPLPGRLP